MIKLIERTAELATIRALLGRGGLLVVEGGAGVGKTALLDTASAIAAQKRRIVYRARGSDLECDFAFGIVRQLFERYSADASKEDRAALFAGSAHVVRGLLLPGSSHLTETALFSMLHELYWLTVNLASHGPVLIAVDDAHWADDASARWLAESLGLFGLGAFRVSPVLRRARSTTSRIYNYKPCVPRSNTSKSGGYYGQIEGHGESHCRG